MLGPLKAEKLNGKAVRVCVSYFLCSGFMHWFIW